MCSWLVSILIICPVKLSWIYSFFFQLSFYLLGFLSHIHIFTKAFLYRMLWQCLRIEMKNSIFILPCILVVSFFWQYNPLWLQSVVFLIAYSSVSHFLWISAFLPSSVAFTPPKVSTNLGINLSIARIPTEALLLFLRGLFGGFFVFYFVFCFLM